MSERLEQGGTLAPGLDDEFYGIVDASYTVEDAQGIGETGLRPFMIGGLDAEQSGVMYGTLTANEGDTDGNGGGHTV